MRIVLASTSAQRRRILAAAGVSFEVAAPRVDETAIKTPARGRGTPERELADILAKAKAMDISSAEFSDALVIGADQTLEVEGVALDKAESVDQLRSNLDHLRGREHALHAAIAVARRGEIDWSHTATVRLTMRDLSPSFLDAYVARHGDAVRSSLGGYWYEGEGAQLFDRVEGDYFSVLGLPLLPLLGYLRAAGALPS